MRPRLIPAAAFVLLGSLFVDQAGVQTDEALFAAPLFRDWRFFSVRVAQSDVPVMNMSYLGAFKTWLYAPILLPFKPAAALIRIPVILIGAVTVVLFCALLDRLHSRRAAWVGAVLLATDTSFLLTTTYDWGPVALQHLLFVSAMLLAVRGHQTGSGLSQAAAAFCCGLAMWDKAVFIWVLSGMLAGLIALAPSIRRYLTLPRMAWMAGAFCAGALPLIVYNVSAGQKLATVRSSAGFGLDRASFEYKLRVLRRAWDGSALFGYLVHEDAPQPGSPKSFAERVCFGVRNVAGEHRRNQMIPAFCAALLLIPFLWRTRARGTILFTLVALAVAWAHMAMTVGGGASVHHAILLAPLPHMLLAVAFAEASRRIRFGRWGLAVAVVILAAGNLLVTVQYLYQFVRNGAAGSWTDAVIPLADDLGRSDSFDTVVLPDWGLGDSLCVLNRNKPGTRAVNDPFMPPGDSPEQRAADLALLADPKAVWVLHTPGSEISQGVNERFFSAVQAAGFAAEPLSTYHDRHGRAVFQTFRLVPAPGR